MDDELALRYSRQLMLKEVGTTGQEKLQRAKVLVIGAGGLGSPALYYLAAAGIGRIGVVDSDTVNISNLHRQIMYTTEDLGRKKVDVVKEKLEKLNPDVNIETYPFRLGFDNIEGIIGKYDLVVNAVDNLETRFLVNDCCYYLRKPYMEGAVSGFKGIIATVIPDKSPCFRCLYPIQSRGYKPPSVPVPGIIGMLPGTIGCMEALEAVKVILGVGETLSGRLLVFDGLVMRFCEIKVEKNPKCPVCGENPEGRMWLEA